MSDPLVFILSVASGATALLGLVVYFVALVRRPDWVRLVNGSGLFFTAAALAQLAVLLPEAAPQGALFTLAIATTLLIPAVLAQSWAALQNRRAWDGVERRDRGADAEPNE